MKLTHICSLALAFAGLVACGGANEPTVGQSSEAVSGSSSGPATVVVDPVCPPDEKICILEDKAGKCTSECVPDTYLCASPKACEPIVCDPLGRQPRLGCSWSTTACVWDCPICDPVGEPPRVGCSWSETTCAWECPVCDPPGPPEGGCTWDEKACVWLCL